jgi:excisionase family DNA binding protein
MSTIRSMSDPLLTTRQVADILGVSAETVLRYTRSGDLPAIRLPGTVRGRLRYRPGDVEEWLARHAATPAQEAPTTLTGVAERRLSL